MRIDTKKLKDFSKPKTLDSIIYDITKRYKIKNIINDYEYIFHIANALYFDYSREIANYEAYIERGMDARLLMDLRKSSILPLEKELWYFYDSNSSCKTIEDVRRVRTEFLKNFNSDYQDLNWQYFFLIKHTWRCKSIDFIFDFEECYEDGDWRLQTNPTDYEREFIEAHMPPSYYE